jgi:hypothetical protein
LEPIDNEDLIDIYASPELIYWIPIGCG